MMRKIFITLLLLAFGLTGCSSIKENKMRKDAVQLIEYSKASPSNILPSTDFLMYAQAMEGKYIGDDLIKFMAIVKEEVKKRVDNGENVGPMQLLLIYDNWK